MLSIVQVDHVMLLMGFTCYLIQLVFFNPEFKVENSSCVLNSQDEGEPIHKARQLLIPGLSFDLDSKFFHLQETLSDYIQLRATASSTCIVNVTDCQQSR